MFLNQLADLNSSCRMGIILPTKNISQTGSHSVNPFYKCSSSSPAAVDL
jgi:hypothetical protein